MAATKRLLTYSAGSAFNTCPRLYELLYVRGIRPIKVARPLVFGTLIHKLVEAYWRARQAGAKDLVEIVLAKHAELTAEFDPFEAARARVMIVTYALVWGTTECEVLAIEVKFETDLIHPQTREVSSVFRRAGRIDLVLRIDGKIQAVEHKSANADVGEGSEYRLKLLKDQQLSMYWAGCISIGFRPDGVIYDILKKFTMKPQLATPPEKRRTVIDKTTKLPRLKAKQREVNETPIEYEKRLAEIVAKDPSAYIVRVPVVRLLNERLAFALDIWNQGQDMGSALERNSFRPVYEHCMKYHSPCAFYDHCNGGAPLDNPMRYTKTNVLHPELEDDVDDSEEEESEFA